MEMSDSDVETPCCTSLQNQHRQQQTSEESLLQFNYALYSLVQTSKGIFSKCTNLGLKDQERQDYGPEDVPRLTVKPGNLFPSMAKKAFTLTTKLRVLTWRK